MLPFLRDGSTYVDCQFTNCNSIHPYDTDNARIDSSNYVCYFIVLYNTSIIWQCHFCQALRIIQVQTPLLHDG